MEFQVGASAEAGTNKALSEDCCLVQIEQTVHGKACMGIVCDGVGGLEYGHKASSYVVKRLSDWFKTMAEVKFELTDILLEQIDFEIENINKELIRMGEDVGSRMGTTLSGIILVGGQYFLFHVGDTRVYLCTKELRCLTFDHTVLATKIRNGQMTEEEAKRTKEKPVLLQCIGATQNLEIQNMCGEVMKNDVFLLCSDGLYKSLNFGEIEDITEEIKYMEEEEIQHIADEMIVEVKSRGELDDVSAIFIKAL